MLFNSDIFLFVFLPLTLLAYYSLGGLGKTRLAIAALVIASLTYYAWWNPIYLPLIFGSMLTNFLVGRLIQNQQKAGGKSKASLGAGVILNLGLLGYFKYANFFVDNVNTLSGSDIELTPIVLPLAISFFTFQQIAYLVDSYQDRVQEVDLLRYGLFVTFFPQLIAGPIVHHTEMMPQFGGKNIGRFMLSNLVVGGTVFFLGLFKKVVFADNLAPYVNTVFNASASGDAVGMVAAWTGVAAYALQIYFDFSGYSDMAIGLARMFGVCLPLNFNSPYKSRSIIDFWRRWHMTLSRFLKDYLYIPLGGNRHGYTRQLINLIITMLLGGLWHGASWTFVVWGGLHGSYLIINHLWERLGGDVRSRLMAQRWYGALAWSLCFVAVVFAWVIFRADTMDAAQIVLTAMVGLGGDVPSSIGMLIAQVDKNAALLIAFALGIAWFAPNTQEFMRDYINKDGVPDYRIDDHPQISSSVRWAPGVISAVAMAALTTFTIMSLWQPSEFIYYQF
jgi:alginate O-acetyltransferase complex protein AlgI